MRTLLTLCLLLVYVPLAVAEEAARSPIKFKKTVLDTTFRSEGVAVGDFNKDGKLDIAAGYVWYEAPDWKMHSLRETAKEYNPTGYSNSFATFADDLNGDGWADIIVVDFPGTPTRWFENPKTAGTLWKEHLLAPVTNNESPQYVDVDGDGRRNLIAAVAPDSKQADGPERRMAFLSRADDPAAPWNIHPVSAPGAASTTKYAHGLGVGDVNGDGRKDIVVPQGWWEAPEDRTAGEWKFHPAPLGQAAADMHVFDFAGNGRNDVVSSSAHGIGVWWYENLGEGKWKTHEIDSSFSQSHALCLADLNGDGLPDLVTGKRWWAHGPKGDVGADMPAVLVWFELSRKEGRPHWTKHEIDDDSGIGTQFQVADVNGDGLLDIVVSNKKGVFLFEQEK